LATSGDFLMATYGDFLMATDTIRHQIGRHVHPAAKPETEPGWSNYPFRDGLAFDVPVKCLSC